MMTRRSFIFAALPIIHSVRAARAAAPAPSEVRVGVFGLFHPQELTVRPASDDIILRIFRAIPGTDREPYLLRGVDQARVIRASGSLQVELAGQRFGAQQIQVAGRTGGAADVELSVPGRISRRFRGRVDLATTGDELTPVVTMDLETAVASVVAAEQIRTAPMEALKALAVAARSYYAGFAGAGGGYARYRRHGHQSGFDFCDTTHCQFLRGPAPAGSPAERAAQETADLVLAFRGEVLAAFYSASCGGRTRSLADAGLEAADGYPYFSVECAYCARRARDGEGREGHGVGLCEAGAVGLASDDVPYREILAYYYPETRLTASLKRGH